MNEKVLHITNWYPNAEKPFEALWIRNHIKSLESSVENEVYHVCVKEGSWKISQGTTSEGTHFLFLYAPVKRWFFIELLTFWLLWRLLKTVDANQFDLVNVHIAYPLLTYFHRLKKHVKVPIVITEHWSAYHFNFGVKKQLPRIHRIFQQGIPLITVSKALANDIQSFAKTKNMDSYVVPNCINTTVFHPPAEKKSGQHFFMVSNWGPPKDPFSIIRAFGNLLKQYPEARLRIGGYGTQEQEICSLIEDLNLSNEISFIGKLDSEQIASEMRKANFFIHGSRYETFSVVCAEALCCGTPVIASGVGGIIEFVHEKNGILVVGEEQNVWEQSLKEAIQKEFWPASKIAEEAKQRFDFTSVGERYHRVYQEIIDRFNKAKEKVGE